jgi:6-phosphofructokinase 1
MKVLRGKLLVGQSGGPTAVINSSLCGVIQEALGQRAIEGIYGARHGVVGILNEDLADLSQEDPAEVDLLRSTPGAALGSCRYKLAPEDTPEGKAHRQRLLDVLAAQEVRYLLYAGGNDSMDTLNKILACAARQGYELRGIGVPKTVDNDLPGTDHCPSYGSVAKHLAAIAMGVGLDMQAVRLSDPVVVMEIQGRHSGWMTASTALARRREGDAPHLLYLPEIPWNRGRFLEEVRGCHARYGCCFISAATALRDEEGQALSAPTGPFARDAFGHLQLGGVGSLLSDLIKQELELKARLVRLGPAERIAMHFGSLTDRDEAFALGEFAVRSALAGESGKMAGLERVSDSPYRCDPTLVGLDVVANAEKLLPREWINDAGNDVTEDFLRYARPLIQGEVPTPIEGGLPRYARLRGVSVPKKLPPWGHD